MSILGGGFPLAVAQQPQSVDNTHVLVPPALPTPKLGVCKSVGVVILCTCWMMVLMSLQTATPRGPVLKGEGTGLGRPAGAGRRVETTSTVTRVGALPSVAALRKHVLLIHVTLPPAPPTPRQPVLPPLVMIAHQSSSKMAVMSPRYVATRTGTHLSQISAMTTVALTTAVHVQELEDFALL